MRRDDLLALLAALPVAERMAILQRHHQAATRVEHRARRAGQAFDAYTEFRGRLERDFGYLAACLTLIPAANDGRPAAA